MGRVEHEAGGRVRAKRQTAFQLLGFGLRSGRWTAFAILRLICHDGRGHEHPAFDGALGPQLFAGLDVGQRN